jgi:nucleotide-binding universal stress UspA family protein
MFSKIAVLGSVAERVVAASPVPVLLLRPGGRAMTALRTILVPVDGSPGGALALASAIALAEAANARLVLVQVVVPVLAYRTGGAWIYGAGLYVDPVRDDEALAAAVADHPERCHLAASLVSEVAGAPACARRGVGGRPRCSVELASAVE